MHPIGALAIYLVAVFLGGALVAPWLYWLVQTFAAVVPDLAASPFHRFVNRSLLIVAVLGMVPLLRGLGIRSLAGIGLVPLSGQGRRLAAGFLLGFVSLAAVALLAAGLGAREWRSELSAALLFDKLSGAALTAATVSLLEEILFRGAFYGALRRTLRPIGALLASSMVYAIVHFLESAPLAGSVAWWSGLDVLPRMLRGFGNLEQVVPGFFNLTLAGALLALAYQRTGNLWFSIGMHAGWIFCLRASRVLTRDTAVNACEWCGSVKLIDGWLALGALALVLVAVLAWRPAAAVDSRETSAQ